VVFGQVRAQDQVNAVVILGMLWQDVDLFFAEYISVILLFGQQLKTYVFSIFTSPKVHPSYKHVVGILG